MCSNFSSLPFCCAMINTFRVSSSSSSASCGGYKSTRGYFEARSDCRPLCRNQYRFPTGNNCWLLGNWKRSPVRQRYVHFELLLHVQVQYVILYLGSIGTVSMMPLQIMVCLCIVTSLFPRQIQILFTFDSNGDMQVYTTLCYM